MRKIVFIKEVEEIKKLMIYDSSEGVYVFGYDSLEDSSGVWDIWFESVKEAEEFCEDSYKISKDCWIFISDPLVDCQHDFITPTRIKGREIGKPEWGKFQILVNNKWMDKPNFEKYTNFGGLTSNERLFTSGLTEEFDNAKLNDKSKADKILNCLEAI